MCLIKTGGWATQFMANARCRWGSSRQELEECVHDGCQSVQNMWDSHPQITPHENDPHANGKLCQHYYEGQMHFLKHLSYWSLTPFISPFSSLTTSLSTHYIPGSFQYVFEAVDANTNSFFAVKVSLKDGWAWKNDDNRMPTLCVLLVILKSRKWLLSWQYERRYGSMPGYWHICIGGQRCDYKDA